tara:strand:+ start:164 stop:430 length:267 start_codon:yes stop_codon:yes gene_type:complete
MNKVKILKIDRPNPNPKNIHGIANVNGYNVTFNFQQLPNLSLKINYINYPEKVKWDNILPFDNVSTDGHHYHCGLVIIKYLIDNKINY